MRRSKSFGFCLVSLLGFNLVACGDGEKNSPEAAGGASAGGPSTGGSTLAQGGASAAGASAGGTTQSIATNVAGTTATPQTTGGATGVGGAETGGATAAGATSTVGGTTASTGGASTAGGPSTGGTATGGTSATGGTTTDVPCFVTFVIPADGASLSNSSDLDDNCTNGIQTNVLAVTNAAEGTTATLDLQEVLPGGATGATSQIGSTTVGSNLQASFANMTLPSSGQSKLIVRVGGPTCSATETVKTDCSGAPTCAVSAPVLTAAHPILNGVPATSGGDRVSSEGSVYQAAFAVSTDAEDGQPVLLTLDSAISVQSTVASGKAQFPGVPLGSDGSHTVQATCVNKKSLSSSTTALTYPVDTAAPSLSVTKVKGGEVPVESALVSGDHFDAEDDGDSATAGLQLKFCAATNSSDAIALDAALTYHDNFCVALGGNNPMCEPITASGETGVACALLDCPGNGAFSVNFTLYDAAGNPTTVTRNNLTCASTAPSVSFIDPVAGTEADKRILAASNALATKKDKNATQSGAQYDVKVCTSATSGTAVLKAGVVGNTLTQIATGTVAADTGSLCNGSYPSAITFADVTLPESVTNASFGLAAATRLQVTVTDQNTAQGSASADIWVDSTTPILTINSPLGLCGLYIYSNAPPIVQKVTFGTSIVPVSVLVHHANGTNSTASAAILSFYQSEASVPLAAGQNVLEATVAEPSGNTGNIVDCQIAVGSTPPPKVVWSSPVSTSLLTAPGNTSSSAIPDADTSTPAWQGTLKACTPELDLAANPGATIQFAVNGQALGEPAVIGNDKCASLTNSTVLEGAAVRLTATTSAIALGGIGSAAITVPVDAVVPSVPTNLVATVKNRRQTSFELKWVAAADGTQSASGYDVRIAKEPVTETNFDNPAIAQAVAFTGMPAAAGSADGLIVGNRLIETDYYFALRAKDAVGNKSPVLATVEKARASFEKTMLLPPTAGQRFGLTADGSGDINGDGLSDVVVGYVGWRQVHIYLGNSSGPAATPDVTIGSNNNTFGYQAMPVGDINGDGLLDLAISTWSLADGRVSVFYGRRTWPSVLTEDEADILILPDPTQSDGAGFQSSAFGVSLARLGDFNSDGVDDFAIGAYKYNSNQGHVSVILGKGGGLASTISVPQAYRTGQAIRMDGDASVKSMYGLTVAGIGSWYAQPSSPVLMVSAQAYGATKGRVYSFSGVAAAAATIPVDSALNWVDGASGATLGGSSLRVVGNLGYAGRGAVLASDGSVKPGVVNIFSGADAEGPFGRNLRYTTAESSSVSSGFARLIIGGGIPGTAAVTSFIGDSRADLVVSTKVGAGPRLYFVDGAKLSSQFASPTTATIQSVMDIEYALPAGWQDFSARGVPARDIDGDGYGDLAIADLSYTDATYDGRVLILW